MRCAFLAWYLLAATACAADPPSGPTVPLDELTDRRGDTATIEGTPLRLQFPEVTGDSRCPAHVVCIQGGDAVVHVRADASAAPVSYALHADDSSRAAVMYQDFRIALMALRPQRFSGSAIAQDDYRASFRVTRP